METVISSSDTERPRSQDISCETCGGEGVCLSTEDRHVTARHCQTCTSWDERNARDRYAELINYAQIPSGFLTANSAQNLLPALEEWYSNLPTGTLNSSNSIFLCGPSGSAKTFSVVALMFRFAKAGKIVRYFDCPQHIMDRRSSYNSRKLAQGADPYTQQVEDDRWSISRCDIAVLDNIGVGTANDWTKEQYDFLIDARQASGA